jgi:hypothetical protein
MPSALATICIDSMRSSGACADGNKTTQHVQQLASMPHTLRGDAHLCGEVIPARFHRQLVAN